MPSIKREKPKYKALSINLLTHPDNHTHRRGLGVSAGPSRAHALAGPADSTPSPPLIMATERLRPARKLGTVQARAHTAARGTTALRARATAYWPRGPPERRCGQVALAESRRALCAGWLAERVRIRN